MAIDRIPLAFGKSTGGAAIEIQELPAGDQVANQWLMMTPGQIEGLLLEWVSTSSIRVSAGSCTLPTIGTMRLSAAVTKTGISPGANNFLHAYAFMGSGGIDFEFVSTGPSAPYSGKARYKIGDVSRRYIGSVLADASGNIIKFEHSPTQVIYTEGIARNLANGTQTSFTNVSTAGQVPASASIAIFAMTNGGTPAFRVRPVGYANPINSRMYGLTAGAYVVGPVPVGSPGAYEYQVDSGGSGNVDIIGYYLDR